MSMKLDELTHGVPKGSQKRYKHPMATDDPKKYVGKWEAYDTPQGLSRIKKKKVKEAAGMMSGVWIDQAGKVHEVDHDNDLHHPELVGDIMTRTNPAFNPSEYLDWDGRLDDHGRQALDELGLDQGWIRLSTFLASTGDGSVGVDVPKNASLIGLKQLLRLLSKFDNNTTFALNGFANPMQRFMRKGEVIGAIRKMIQEQPIKESLSTPVPFVWDMQKPLHWLARFQSGTARYHVAIGRTSSNPDLWVVAFDTDWGGVKNSTQEVFATVLAVIKDFFQKKQPGMVWFKPNNTKLMRLYKAMSKALTPTLEALGYEVDYRRPTFGVIKKKVDVTETRLDELMDRPANYVWDEARQDGHVETASFESSGVKYVAFFTLKNYMSYELNDAENFKSIRNKRKVWEMEFDRVGWEPFISTREALKKKPKGKALEVLSTVAAIIGEFLRKKNPDQLYFSTTSPGLKIAYRGMGRILQPKLHSLGYELDWREPLKGQLVGYIERRSAMLPEDTDVSYVTRRAPTQNAIGAEELYPTDVIAQRKSKKAPLKTVRQSVKALGGKLPRLDETIRKPQFGIMNTDYEVQDEAGNVIGVCEIHDNVIEKLRTKITDEEYLGKILRNLLSVLVREADRIKAPLRMQLQPGSRDDLKRFLERFGFRHVGDNIMKRIEGSVTPPSVIMATGINGSDEA